MKQLIAEVAKLDLTQRKLFLAEVSLLNAKEIAETKFIELGILEGYNIDDRSDMAELRNNLAGCFVAVKTLIANLPAPAYDDI